MKNYIIVKRCSHEIWWAKATAIITNALVQHMTVDQIRCYYTYILLVEIVNMIEQKQFKV